MTTHRTCGDCTLCCRLLPVNELHKKGGERCQHQRRDGCAVYRQIDVIAASLARQRFVGKMPVCCSAWSCRWLIGDDAGDLRRPDRVHYCIDIMPDFIEARDNKTGHVGNVEVIQVWIDPAFPDAHRDAGLRAYLLRRGEERKVALIRSSPHDAFVLVPPNMTGTGEWLELKGESSGREHSLMETANALGRAEVVLHK